MVQKVRRATAEDAPAVEALFEEFYKQTKYNDIVPPSAESNKILVKGLLGDGGVLQVGEIDGEVVGVIAGIYYPFPLNLEHYIVAELAFYIRPEARGTGLGKQLIRKFEQVSRQRGASAVILSSLASLDPRAANKLYSKEGYVPNESTFLKEL